MPRLPRKVTTASLGHHQIKWLLDQAESEGNKDLASACDAAMSTRSSKTLRDMRVAQRVVVDEINRRAGHPAATATAKSSAQLDREIREAMKRTP